MALNENKNNNHTRRRLLDVEKLVFRTDAQGRAKKDDRADDRASGVALRARRGSVHRDGPGGGPEQLVYNIGERGEGWGEAG
jgi:hypothetical protein